MAFAFTQPELKRTILSLFPAIVIFTSCCVLALYEELRVVIPMLVGTSAVMTIMLVCTLYFGERGKISWSPCVILLGALLLRLLFLFSPPQLSDDLYRYLWDGNSLISGTNPYAAAPSAITPPQAVTKLHSRINHPDYVTIYPPMAQIIFGSGAALNGTTTGLKAFLTLIDICLCALLIALLKRFEMPAWRAVLYAWNPLPVVEIAGSGHVDGAGMALLLAALFFLVPERKEQAGTTSNCRTFLLSGALLASAGLVKLLPFVFAPLLLLLVPSGKRRYVIAGCIGTTALLVIPFLPDIIQMTGSLDSYAKNWEFSGFTFTALRSVTGSGMLARLLLSATFLLILSVTTYRLAQRLKQTEGSTTGARETVKACYVTALAFLLLTPTLQPWYALTLAAFLPFCAGPAGVVLCWAVFLTYQVQIPYFILGHWLENQQVTAVVFLAPVTAYLISKLLSDNKGMSEKSDVSAHQ